MNKLVEDYLLPRGRIGRAQFIVRVALIWMGWGVLPLVLVIPLSFGFSSEKTVTAGVILLVVLIGLFLAALLFFWGIGIQAAKRLHDFNRSGAWVFVGLIMAAWIGRLASIPTGSQPSNAALALGVPGFLGLLIFGLILSLRPGTKETNRFGLASVTSRRMRVAAVVCVVSFLSIWLLTFIGGFIGIKSARQERNPERHSDVRSAQARRFNRKNTTRTGHRTAIVASIRRVAASMG